jgi:uncharacterized protein (TIGR03435 family)
MSMLDPHARNTSPFFAWLVVTFGLLTLGTASLQVRAQAPAPPAAAAQMPATSAPAIEVASIKRNREVEQQRAAVNPNFPQVPGRAQTLRGGLVSGRGMSVEELIRDAYGYRNRAHGDIVGRPAWVDTERYDVQAKFNREFPASTSMGLPPDGEAALRVLLAERFKLKVRVETRLQPIYELVVHRADGKLGPNLLPAKGGCRAFFTREAVNVGLVLDKPKEGEPAPLPPCMASVGYAMIVFDNTTLPDWAKIVALRPQINRTVIDRTGLAGNFDIRLMNPAAGDPNGVTLLPPIKPLLEDQLGLTLRDAEGPVEILVIENIERPSEN